jgi:hypothetical protein
LPTLFFALSQWAGEGKDYDTCQAVIDAGKV